MHGHGTAGALTTPASCIRIMEKKKTATQPKAAPPEDSANVKGTVQLEPTQLAMLAALLDPGARKLGDAREARSALFHAAALWEESVKLCEQMGNLNCEHRLDFVLGELEGNSGAKHLMEVLARRQEDPRIREALPDRPLDISSDEFVRQVTGEKRLERAMPAFRKWIAYWKPEADFGTEKERLRRKLTTVNLALQTVSYEGWRARDRSAVNRDNAMKRKPAVKKNLQKEAKKGLDEKTPQEK